MPRAWVILISLLLLCAFILLSLWNSGIIEGSAENPTEVYENGVYGFIETNAGNGVLVGDVVHISLKVFFDERIVRLDEASIAEKYIGLKENELINCEERAKPHLKKTKINRDIRLISLDARFQCWSTKADKVRIEVRIPYTTGTSTGAIVLARNIDIVPIAVGAQPRPLYMVPYDELRANAWLISGYFLIFLGIVLLLIFTQRIKLFRRKDAPMIDTKRDYFEECIERIKDALRKDPASHNIIRDSLYHLCLKMEKERGSSPKIDHIKYALGSIYANRPAGDLSKIITELENAIKEEAK